MTIAIIGAGMAGAACASQLIQQGWQVSLFDKGRSVGGRMSSKRTEQGYLDLGAQYFTARDTAFLAQCQHWLRAGSITHWQGRLAQLESGAVVASPDEEVRFIGVPSMQVPVAALLQGLALYTGRQVERLAFDGNRWQLFSAGASLGCFEQLVLAIPQQQAEPLLRAAGVVDAELSTVFSTPALLPCWAVNVQLSHSPWPYDGIFGNAGSQFSWLARQSSKPGRSQGEHWLLHFSTAFSLQHLESDSSEIAGYALTALQQLVDQPLSADVTHCHRWRYARQNPAYPLYGMWYRPALALGLAGDWLYGGRVEHAWLSGMQLARELLR
ncbi:FAD-dependent oxidoreductase [Rheinheimera sp.]|uniref:NAD(P)/FAD-dependent oxidoreductase n=1 Tax=Rheinheimera sp. TaxID=1869214 RepID=UPI00307D4B88